MCVIRTDLNLCIGCKSCVTICPMDVFRFNEKEGKSVIAFVESCQSCGQCFVNCPSRSLGMNWYAAASPLTSYR